MRKSNIPSKYYEMVELLLDRSMGADLTRVGAVDETEKKVKKESLQMSSQIIFNQNISNHNKALQRIKHNPKYSQGT